MMMYLIFDSCGNFDAVRNFGCVLSGNHFFQLHDLGLELLDLCLIVDNLRDQ